MRFCTIPLCFLVLFGGVARPVVAAPPELNTLYPAGAQRGTTTTIQVSPPWKGKDVQAWCSLPGVTLKPLEKAGELEVAIAPEATPGIAWIRLYSPEGASSPRPFRIGSLPDVLEKEPNNKPTEATPLPDSRAVAHGRLEKSGEVDTFAVSLKQGQTLVAAMQANQVFKAPMDGVLQLLDSRGFVLEQNDDGPSLDPFLTYSIPSDGTYYLRTFAFPETANSSINLAGGADYIYQLTVTTGPYVDHLLPLSITAGQEFALRPLGWNLPETPVSVKAEAAPGLQTVAQPEWGNVATALVTEFPSRIEEELRAQGAGAVAWPVVVTGELREEAETDAYFFAAKKGDRLRFRVESRGLGQLLDPVLKVRNEAGAVLKEVDDSTRGQEDALLDFPVPADGRYQVQVSDLHRGGGLRYAYRLTIAPPAAEFSLSVEKDHYEIAPGKELSLTVKIDRSQFDGEIEISLGGEIPGVTAESVVSQPKGDTAKEVKLLLKATAEAKHNGPLSIVARSKTDNPIVRQLGQTAPQLLWLTVLPGQP